MQPLSSVCVSCLTEPSIQLFSIRPVLVIAHGSRLPAEALSLTTPVCLSIRPPALHPTPQSDSVLSLCLGLDMEERTRQMKLKMNKYKQVAGSDSRLEQDYHKVKKKTKKTTRPDTVNVCFATLRAQ